MSANIKLKTPSNGSVTIAAEDTASDVVVTIPATNGELVTSSASGNVVISDNSTNAALRITQVGSGNALLVEDSANPDATPFVINNAGTVIKGNDTAVLYSSGVSPQIQLNIAGAGTMGISRWSANTANNALVFLKSRGATIGDFTSVASGDNLGAVNFYGTDGTAGIQSASITSSVDGTPGTNDMPGRLVFSTTADGASSVTERMRIDSSGNLLVGSSSYLLSGMTAGQAIQLGARTFIGTTSGGDTSLGGLSGSNLTSFLVNGTERMRLDASGNLLVGTTSTSLSAKQTIFSINTPTLSSWRGGTNGTHVNFINSVGGTVGSISVDPTTTTYATSSDYRLKENVAPMTGALAKVAALKPCTYTWKLNGEAGQGFIAHELQEVVPDCVTGEKDAVDAEGNPQYQGVDTSFLVATLVSAIQEQQTLIQSLTARLEALENK